MEFSTLSRRLYSSRKVLSGEEQGDTAVFTGYAKLKQTRFHTDIENYNITDKKIHMISIDK